MRSVQPNTIVIALFLLIATLTTGMVIATPTVAAQHNGLGTSHSSSPTTPTILQTPQSNGPDATAAPSSNPTVASGKPHFFLQTGKTNADALASTSNNVYWNGGPTMHVSVSYAIYWLPNGTNFEQSSGTNSAYISLIDRFLNDTTGTSYYNILNQYSDNITGAPLDQSVLGASYLDTTPYPKAGTQSDPLHDSDIQAEVVRAMRANNWSAGPDKIFHVFTGYGIESCYDAFNRECTFNVYCAYHNYFAQGSQSVIYSNMPDFNGLSGHCTPRGLPPPNGDYYADPEINILSHELFEAVSDPLINAWHDAFSEIGDKCAWIFGVTNQDGSNLVLNGHKYLVQLEWSNYDGGCVLRYGPSHSVLIAPAPGSNPFPSAVSYNITYTSQGSKWWSTTAFANGTLTLRIDQNTQIAITSQASEVNQSEKWCFDQNCSGSSFNSGDGLAITFYYYDFLAQPVSVSPAIDIPSASLSFATGPLVPSPPGSPQLVTVRLNGTTQTIWVPRGAAVSVPSPTSVGVNTRWVTRISTWVISYASQLPNPIVYYPQYLTTFQYGVTGGGFYSPPTVTYYDAGIAKTVPTGNTVWVDTVSSYGYQIQLPGSTTYERWSTINPTGIVSTPGGVVSTEYYHEYNITMSVQFAGGSPSTSPSLTGESYGLNVPTALSTQSSTIWLDAGSTYSLTGTLAGASPFERWQAEGPGSGVVGGSTVLSPTYVHQYFLTVTGAPIGTSGQGWYDSGSTASATSPGLYGATSTARIRLVSYNIDNGLPTTLNTIDAIAVHVTMNLPHSIRFSSGTQYLLTVVLPTDSIVSITPSPTGDSWYDSGTSAFVMINKNWDVMASTRQSLVSFSIDNLATSVDRASTTPTASLAIPMAAGHILSAQSVTQYFISVQGATLSGSQTADGWFDSGSQFTVEGAYSHSYSADFPYYAYAMPAGFLILANATVGSLLWDSSNHTLSFLSGQVTVSVYIPAELSLVPTGVSDDGAPIMFTYSQASHAISFRGYSRFQIAFSSTTSSSSTPPMVPVSDWVLYPAIISIVVGAIVILGLVLVRRQPRKPGKLD